MTCLFSPPSGRPAGGQVLLLALARHGPDMDDLVSDLKRLDPANGFESPQGLDQILNFHTCLVWLPLSLCRYSTLSG